MSESKRLFVGNLPDDISDAEVRSQFKNYGQITSLEIKSKKAADGSVISTFAFVDLVVSPSQLSQCLSNTDGCDMQGNRIRVQVAKESFMSKLKAEREQMNRTPGGGLTRSDQAPRANGNFELKPKINSSMKFDEAPKKNNSTKFDFLPKTEAQPSNDSYNPLQMIRSQKASIVAKIESENTPSKTATKEKPKKKPVVSSSSSSSDSSDSDEDAPAVSKKPTSLTKKKTSLMSELENFSGMWNDLDAKPVVVELKTEEPPKPPLTESLPVNTIEQEEVAKKKELDNQKRIQSLQERSKQLQSQTIQIQSSLNLTDKQMNRKIVFDQNGEEETSKVKGKKKNKAKFALFDEEAVDPNKMDDDDYFKLRPHLDGKSGKELLDLQSGYGNDSRFKLDKRFGDMDDEMENENQEDQEYNEEKDRQMSILSSLVPGGLAPTPFDNKDTSNQLTSKAFVRFDPKVQEHKQFEKTVEKHVLKDGKKKNRKDDSQYGEQQPVELPEVSSERYYSTTTALNIGSNSQSTGGFSLRTLFQTPEQEEEIVAESRLVPNESVQVKDRTVQIVDPLEQQKQATGYWKNAGMWHETLFLQSNDSRIKEALDFIFKKTEDEPYRDRNLWPDHRDRLMRFYKNKMRRSTSSQIPGTKRTLETADESGHLYKAQPDARKKPRKQFFKK